MENSERYKRQIILPEIGVAGQEKIARASILVIGAGGLGSPALLYLAAAGVGHIGIVDFDDVDETNLQRQVLFQADDVGHNKAKTASKRLNALNPDINIEAIPEELNDKNIESLFNSFDIIIDGSDNFATKFLINDAAVKTGKPFIYGSILGFDGQVSVFNTPNAPCYRCLFPKPPQGHIPNCAENGVIGAVAGIIGVTQAMEAIKLIVGHKSFKPLIGKLWTIDVRSMENRILNLPKDPECAICSKNKSEIELQYVSPICGFIPDITPAQTRDKTNALLIDVREGYEWDAGHIEGAKHIPLSWLMQGNLPDLPKDQEIILYCQKGMRSKQAAILLQAANFKNLSNMSGGYEKWPNVN